MVSSSTAPRRAKSDPERLELLLHVPGPDPEDQPAAGEMVEGGVLLGGDQRMPQADDRDMAQQPHVLGDARRGSARVATGSYQVVLIASASRRGMATWSQQAM